MENNPQYSRKVKNRLPERMYSLMNKKARQMLEYLSIARNKKSHAKARKRGEEGRVEEENFVGKAKEKFKSALKSMILNAYHGDKAKTCTGDTKWDKTKLECWSVEKEQEKRQVKAPLPLPCPAAGGASGSLDLLETRTVLEELHGLLRGAPPAPPHPTPPVWTSQKLFFSPRR